MHLKIARWAGAEAKRERMGYNARKNHRSPICMPIHPEEARRVLEHADLLHDREAVEAALSRLAQAVTERLAQRNPLILCVMQGGLVPTGLLLPRLDFPLQVDYIHATRYRGDTRGGELRWIARPATPLLDRVVLLVDDIHDEGLTLEAIARECRAAGAAEVYSAVLVNKVHDRKHGLRADFAGLDVPDRYVFGYGMDYKEYLRNVPGIYAVRETDA